MIILRSSSPSPSVHICESSALLSNGMDMGEDIAWPPRRLARDEGRLPPLDERGDNRVGSRNVPLLFDDRTAAPDDERTERAVEPPPPPPGVIDWFDFECVEYSFSPSVTRESIEVELDVDVEL